MNVELTAVPALECAEAKVEGNSMAIVPVFWNPKELANVASIIVKNSKGAILFKGVLRVSGQTGRPSIAERSKPVQPAVDRNAVKK